MLITLKCFTSDPENRDKGDGFIWHDGTVSPDMQNLHISKEGYWQSFSCNASQQLIDLIVERFKANRRASLNDIIVWNEGVTYVLYDATGGLKATPTTASKSEYLANPNFGVF